MSPHISTYFSSAWGKGKCLYISTVICAHCSAPASGTKCGCVKGWMDACMHACMELKIMNTKKSTLF